VVAPPFNEIVPRWIRRDWGIVVDLLDRPPMKTPQGAELPAWVRDESYEPPPGAKTWLLVSFDSSRLPMVFSTSEVTTIEYERMVIPNHGCG